MNYWEKRTLEAQQAITDRNIKDIEKQVAKYYKTAASNTVGGFLITYNKILQQIEKGQTPTPALLYKLDTYWQQQGQLKQELQRLGDKQTELYIKKFKEQFYDIYNSFAIKDDTNFHYISDDTVEQVIKYIWCADGKSFSDRVWNNTDKLQQALNDELINCVLTGKSPKQLRERLMYQFNVSYGRADSLVRTELAHIQTKAAEQRYMDMGVKYVQVWADKDERRCDVCGKLHTKVYVLGRDKIPIPAHTNCRCSIIPVTKPQEGRMAGLLQMDKGK